MLKKLTGKLNIICILPALLHLALTFVSDKNIFTFPDASGIPYKQAVVDYVTCKILAFMVLYGIYYGICLIIFDRDGKGKKIFEIVKSAALYLPIVLIVLVIKLPAGFITNDEISIYNNAVTLTHDTWFNYLTTYYYIVSLMLIPFKYGPIILKALIQLLTVGYVVYRVRDYYGRKTGLITYVIFLLYPVIAYTTSAHRLPLYFLLYLIVFTKLLFDKLNGRELSAKGSFFMLLAGAVLTQWRTEGIYLLVIIPLLCFIVYANLRSPKSFIKFIVCFILLQYLVSIPQNGIILDEMDAAANDRMKPFYAYTITNMYRNGLDLEKNAEDLAIVDKYLSLDVIEAINEHYGDINYEDVLILYQDGYMGVREDATVSDFINYSNAVKRIFINNPGVFIKTRWGAFCYAALPYHFNFGGGVVSLLISVVKTISYNLFIPHLIILLLLIYSLVRRKWYTFFVSAGLLCHFAIVFVLAPASYFKYYFPIYIMAYFYLMLLVVWAIAKKGDKAVKGPVI